MTDKELEIIRKAKENSEKKLDADLEFLLKNISEMKELTSEIKNDLDGYQFEFHLL